MQIFLRDLTMRDYVDANRLFKVLYNCHRFNNNFTNDFVDL